MTDSSWATAGTTGRPPSGSYPYPQYGAPTATYPTDLPRTSGPDRLRLVLAAGWLAVTIAAAVAPLLTFLKYTYRFQGGGTTREVRTTTSNGWGSYHISGGGAGAIRGQHDVIYGIPLTIIAVLLVAATVGLFVSRVAVWPRLLGLVGTVAMTATGAAVLLDGTSRQSDSYDTPTFSVMWHLGAGLWVSVGAAAVGAALAVVAFVSLCRPPRTEGPTAQPGPHGQWPTAESEGQWPTAQPAGQWPAAYGDWSQQPYA